MSDSGFQQGVLPSDDEIHLWYRRVENIADAALWQSCRAQLDAQEDVVFSRILSAPKRLEYLCTRLLIRNVLSLYLPQVRPEQWQFLSNEYGKPAVAGPFIRPLCFNLSHANGMIVLAISRALEIGIDVESRDRMAAHVELAHNCFSAGESALLRLLNAAPQAEAVCQLWTLKESYVKARGMGLSIPFDTFAFSFPDEAGIGLALDDDMDDVARHWRFWVFEADVAHRVALALKVDDAAARFRITVREVLPSHETRPVRWATLRQSRV